MSYLTPNYSPLNISFVHGSGCYLFDKNDNKYLDCLSGVGVMVLGHSHPKIVNAICKQAKNLIHTSNWYHIDLQEQLAEKLCKLANLNKVFFANSGAEANEAAIKVSRLFANKNNISNPIILTANNGFHGRTMATLSATGNKKVQNKFDPLMSEFINIDFNDLAAIKQYTNNPNVVAIMLEPIQGEHGVIIPNDNYLQNVRKICNENNWLMILDEVQTGIARTGKMFAFEYSNITPDILTIAKGLGCGVPIGACLIDEKYSNLLTINTHGSTFGGNPLVCSAAIAVLNTIESEKIIENVNLISDYFKNQIQTLDQSKIKQIRIKGLMIGIELNIEPKDLMQLALDEKILINTTNNTIRLLPPLIFGKKEVDIVISKISKLIKKL